jgi:hypothetical protein
MGIERQDLLRFSAFLRDVKKLQPRTVYNKFENVMSFLKANHIGGLASKNDWSRYVEDEPESDAHHLARYQPQPGSRDCPL